MRPSNQMHPACSIKKCWVTRTPLETLKFWSLLTGFCYFLLQQTKVIPKKCNGVKSCVNRMWQFRLKQFKIKVYYKIINTLFKLFCNFKKSDIRDMLYRKLKCYLTFKRSCYFVDEEQGFSPF